MESSIYKQLVNVRWADLDPNFHVRHSVYYDWGAVLRMQYLSENGLTTGSMMKLGIGPIIFREECVFRREIRMDDQVEINVKILKSRRDHSRWTLQHEIYKNGDTLAAIITLDGAWMDVRQRKLAIPPAEAIAVFDKMPKNEAFEWNEK
jgi:acyl-CoA thioester hydrolase